MFKHYVSSNIEKVQLKHGIRKDRERKNKINLVSYRLKEGVKKFKTEILVSEYLMRKRGVKGIFKCINTMVSSLY